MIDFDRIQGRILASRKYRDLHPAVVRRQIEELADRYSSDKDLEQAVRRKLHQAFGAYIEGNWLRKFKAGVASIDSDDPESLLQASRRLMDLHTSTRERADILGDFAELMSEVVPDGATVLDVACGMNALSLPAINRLRRFHYIGVDLHQGLADQMAAFASAAELDAEFLWDDVLSAEFPASDVVLLLKLLPCLDHQEEGAALRLIRSLDAEILMVSYPTRSIGGSNVGMETNYQMQIARLAKEVGRTVEGYAASTEAFYVLK